MQKDQLLEETLVAESQAQLINLEHRSHLSSNSSGNSAASSGQSLSFVVRKDSFAFYQTQEPTKLLTDTPFDKRQSKFTAQINKDFFNSNNLTPKSNLKTDHRKKSSEYTHETIVDKPTLFFDDLQNPTGNKTHDKVA